MLTRTSSHKFRGRWSLVAAAALVAAGAPAVHAITFVYVCLCCRPDGSIRYLAGWSRYSCDSLENFKAVVGCDDLFTALTLPPSGGVGNGYAPAFDRAVTIGSPILSTDGVTVTRIVMGTYPAPDTYTPGSYSTRLFAIQEAGIPGAPNRFAPIDLNLTGLDPTADSIDVTSIPGGEPIPGLFDMVPGPVIADGDVSIVVSTYRAEAPCCDPVDHCHFAVDFASLVWQDALDLPPACLGDCDRSGGVSFADITTTLANFNHAYPVGVLTPGDANGDRVVNFGDVTTVLANFGATCM